MINETGATWQGLGRERKVALILSVLRLATATTLCVLAAHVAPALGADPAPARGPVNAEFFAKASNGYNATLKSEGDRLQLTLARDIFPGLVYSFHGRVSASGIEARIADLGTIDLRFVPAGKTKRVAPPKHCTGPEATLTEGHFLGAFHFRAEGGVAKIDLAHARGAITTPGWHCKSVIPKNIFESAPSDLSYTFLQASEKARQVGFDAITTTDPHHPGVSGTEFSASMLTRRGPVKVVHVAVTLAENAFTSDSALSTATATPPEPFSGSATFCRACAAGSQWTGDLSVSLPGITAPVKLAGPGYDVSLKSFVGGGEESPTG